jgi:hypothetical protein
MNDTENGGGVAIESTPLLAALDALWGCCESLYGVCRDLIDNQDARIIDAGKAITDAQEHIIAMQDAANAKHHARREAT